MTLLIPVGLFLAVVGAVYGLTTLVGNAGSRGSGFGDVRTPKADKTAALATLLELKMAGSPNAPAEILRKLAAESPALRQVVLENPNCPDDLKF